MRDFLFHLEPGSGHGLQAQIRQLLVDAILEGQLAGGSPLPSCRKLARDLGVARNTVVLAYQTLTEEGYLIARERSGYYVNGDIADDRPAPPAPPGERTQIIDWGGRMTSRPSLQHNIVKPRDWRRHPYPFIYGQIDPALFPLSAWRACSRQTLAKAALSDWIGDSVAADDPLLVDEVRTRVLPRRGVQAAEDEILITMGAQHGLFLLATLLMNADTTVGLENPGYVDARNIFANREARLKPLAVDHGGLVVGRRLHGCDYLYVTPSHQSPTTVTMPLERCLALLEQTAKRNIIIIEDDYEPEANYRGQPTTALKSLDSHGRVIHMGSFSKALAPGLRMGYLVAAPALIREARALRRLMLRHPPGNNQRTVALFLREGHYDALVHRLQRVYRERWEIMGAALTRLMPEAVTVPAIGGTSFWVIGPARLDAAKLAAAALEQGIIIEPGDIHFLDRRPPRNRFRLGFSSIATDRIEPGLERLARLMPGAMP